MARTALTRKVIGGLVLGMARGAVGLPHMIERRRLPGRR
jgi:hypothetical protein